MPLYLDIHHKMEGLTAEEVAACHAEDLEVQDKYGVKYLWLLVRLRRTGK